MIVTRFGLVAGLALFVSACGGVPISTTETRQDGGTANLGDRARARLPDPTVLAIDVTGGLYVVETPSGAATLVGESRLPLTDIAWDRKSRTLYAIDKDTLYALDPGAATPTMLAKIAPQRERATATGLVAAHGSLYVSFEDVFVGVLDPATGSVQERVDLHGCRSPTRGDGDLALVGNALFATALFFACGEDPYGGDMAYRLDLGKDQLAQEGFAGHCVNGLVAIPRAGGTVLYGFTCDGDVLEIDQTLNNYDPTPVGKSNVKFQGATAF